jgi:metallo-beta-lactamase class B
MMRRLFVIAAVVLMTASQAEAQDPPGVLRGPKIPNQSKWNAKGPWGPTSRVAEVDAQKKSPFKVFDNVHYVGLQTVSAYLVATSDGLVLIDSGYAATVDWTLESIRQSGFDPSNLKYVFVTHSHTDHAGGAARIKQASGARVGLSAEDWVEVERQQKGPQAQRNFPVPLARDLVLRDGDKITLGDTTFTFYFTPGHTPGATSVEFPVRDGGRTYRAVVPGGLGLQYEPVWGPVFKKSIERLRQLGPWDAALGNHPFLSPKDLEVIEAQLAKRGGGPHPALLGPTAITAWFDEILKIVDEKLIAEPPPAPSASR